MSSITAVIVTLGFPEALRHWTNEQVLNFIHLMWEKAHEENSGADLDRDLDPLNFLSGPADDKSLNQSNRPLEATIVVEVAKKAYDSLVANGVDVFSRKSKNFVDPSSDSPLADETIMIESLSLTEMPTTQVRSFVAPPESKANGAKQDMPDPARKQRIVEWLCSNIKFLNELSQIPFNSRELWKLHQHYFTPVVKESGGTASHCLASSDSRIASSVPEVSRGSSGGSHVTPSAHSSEEHLSIPVSDPVLPGAPTTPHSLPILKRKVSYRALSDAMISPPSKFEPQLDSSDPKLQKDLRNGSVAKMIEEGHTGHSLPPKTKRARRNRTRISFVPRIKAKLDSYLDKNHEKALITMRQLHFVERAILSGQVNSLEPSASARTHLSGILASEAEMIIVDMI